jgi:ABC-2 type transport system permease protein
VINYDEGNLSTIALNILEQTSEIVYNSTEKYQGIQAVKDQDGVALIIIHKDFTKDILEGRQGEIEVYWIMKGAGILDSISSSVVEEVITKLDQNISLELISDYSEINTSNALVPTTLNQTTQFKNIELKGMSPNDIAGILSQQSTFIPIVMMMIIIMSGGTVISSMALEKENKTLETLLTLPVKRYNIVAGKIIAAGVVGLMLAVIYMIGMGYYLQSFQLQSGQNLSTYGLALTGTDFILIGISVFVTLLAALSLCMVLGSLAKNYKSAQTLTFPVTLLALIPMFMIMFKDFDTLPTILKGALFSIPFSHPMMAPRALIFDDYFLVIAGIIYSAIFAIIMISISVWIFKTDRLLTGSLGLKLNLRKK